jgi:hypothetical protein
MNVSNMVLDIWTSNVVMVVGHYAMATRTYTSVTFANIFGIHSWTICFRDGNMILSHHLITSQHNHGLSTTDNDMYPFVITDIKSSMNFY